MSLSENVHTSPKQSSNDLADIINWIKEGYYVVVHNGSINGFIYIERIKNKT